MDRRNLVQRGIFVLLLVLAACGGSVGTAVDVGRQLRADGIRFASAVRETTPPQGEIPPSRRGMISRATTSLKTSDVLIETYAKPKQASGAATAGARVSSGFFVVCGRILVNFTSRSKESKALESKVREILAGRYRC